ncbi:hypothetical protein JVT61DRAFT_6212 [Boletus reticuloceps]|uniref:Uncharacterized protein n=1 Tax=Boletus reticuloceps TaxID=495285 RepID=A0A8I3A858_9AGAM|nr:hypothetical protein JVT61DRAFT_6212 [Boletus reticuloceps]
MVAFAILWFSFQQCHAQENSVLPWRLAGGNETLGPNQLMECDSLDILLSSETSYTLQSNASYYVLAFEPGGTATVSFVGYDSSALRWTIQHPAGTQLILALLDSFGTSLGVRPDIYAVIPGPGDCLAKSETPGILLEATEPKTTPLFGRPISCRPWETSFSGGKLPNLVDAVVLEPGGVHGDFAPSGEYILPYTSRGGQPAVIVSDANGMLDTTGSIIRIWAKDTPFAGISEAFSRCRTLQQISMLVRSRGPPHPTTSRLRRSFSERHRMQLSRGLVTVNSSNGDTIAVAVCVSLGGMGIVAMAIYVIVMYRRRKKVLDAQDTLPRPFEMTVPAVTRTGASTITHDSTSVPTLTIYPSRVYSQRGRSGTYEARRKESLTRVRSHGAGSTPIPTIPTPWQPQPGSSHDTGMQPFAQPHLSDTSLLLNRAPPSYHTPPRSWTRPHTIIPSDPQSQSCSRAQFGQSIASVNRSISVQERRSAKHALWLSRSASELYRMPVVPRHRVPEYDLHASLGRYAYDDDELRIDTFSRSTNHLRQSYSASPVAHVQHVCSDSNQEEDAGPAIIFQHQDAGLMQELPPPYHQLVGSDAEV